MNLLSIEKITKTYGSKEIFSELTFGIASEEKIGLIGVNGTGKSTLLKVIAGFEAPDQGEITSINNCRIGYLSQNPILNENITVVEEVLQGNTPLMKLVRDYEEILIKIAQFPADPELQKKLFDLNQRMDTANAWQVESEAKTILTKLGITQFDAKIKTLSGGQRKRVALAAALISQTDLLILDEPTNHIDNQSVDWLEQYLKERKGALLMVTHDRYFLDRVVGRIFELSNGKLYSYSGNYSLFLEKKAERLEQEAALTAKQENLYRRELAWIKRGAKARTTKQQARIDRFEKLNSEMQDKPNLQQMEIVSSSSRLGKKVITLENINKSFDSKQVITDFSYIFAREDRVGIIGLNGMGKTTLLKLIAGQLQPEQGKIETGPTVKLGYFSQDLLEMNGNERVIEYIKAQAEHLPTADGGTISASQMCERFLFPPAQQWTPIAKLSGGEKRRLYLLRILMSAPNVLLLDEPTNDLDIQTLSILEDYLDDFPGVVIVVSHDRYFLDRVVDKIIAFEEQGKIICYVGNYSDYMEYRQKQALLLPPKDLSNSSQKSSGQNQENKKPKDKALKLSYNEQRELAGIEDVISNMEHELGEIKQQIEQAGSDYIKLQELTVLQAELEKKLEKTMERWEYLNELALEIANK